MDQTGEVRQKQLPNSLVSGRRIPAYPSHTHRTCRTCRTRRTRRAGHSVPDAPVALVAPAVKEIYVKTANKEQSQMPRRGNSCDCRACAVVCFKKCLPSPAQLGLQVLQVLQMARSLA